MKGVYKTHEMADRLLPLPLISWPKVGERVMGKTPQEIIRPPLPHPLTHTPRTHATDHAEDLRPRFVPRAV